MVASPSLRENNPGVHHNLKRRFSRIPCISRWPWFILPGARWGSHLAASSLFPCSTLCKALAGLIFSGWMDPVIFLALSKQHITADPARLHQDRRAAPLIAPLLFIYLEPAGAFPPREAELAEGCSDGADGCGKPPGQG